MLSLVSSEKLQIQICQSLLGAEHFPDKEGGVIVEQGTVVCVPVHERGGREGGEGERKECILWLGLMVTELIIGLHRAVLETQGSLVC